MMRARDLGQAVGHLPAGPANAISDVEGVGVGHAEIGGSKLYCGLSAVLPYPLTVKERRLYCGGYALGGGGRLTGRGVAEDFGTFSSPIVLAPAPALGRVYDEAIAYGIERDPGLSTDTGWPPVVLGVDDAFFNEPASVWRLAGHQDLHRALAAASSGVGAGVAEGNVGIGRGLVAFGYKGGVGSASRLYGGYRVGALVAAGGGDAAYMVPDFEYGKMKLDQGGYGGEGAVILATDAPLLPHQLDRLAERAFIGVVRSGLVGPLTLKHNVLAFSTVPTVAVGDESPLDKAEKLEEGELPLLGAAAAEAAEEAVYNAVLAATAVEFGGKKAVPLPLEALRRGRGK
jgi:D-aminopeptidase